MPATLGHGRSHKALGGYEDEMSTHVIIEARTRQVRASVDAPGEGTTIFAVDLVGDTWDDFVYFSEQAAQFESARDLRKRNRYVRVAVAALFSHLDGLVSELFTILRTEASFKTYLPKNPDFCSLRTKIAAVEGFYVHERAITLPVVDFNMKILWDIVNHPSVTKKAGTPGSSGTLYYDSADVYGIAIDDLTATASAIGQWLKAVCAAAGHERFRDTKRLCEDFARAIGGPTASMREFLDGTGRPWRRPPTNRLQTDTACGGAAEPGNRCSRSQHIP